MATNVFIRGLGGRGFRVKNSSSVPKVVKADNQGAAVNGIQVDVDVPETQRILSRETDNYIRCADATTTTIIIRGLHRTGFRIKNSAGNWVKVKRGTSATVDVAKGETRRILRRNKRDWIRMPASGNVVSIRGLEAGPTSTPRGLGFAIRDLQKLASATPTQAGANNDILYTSKLGSPVGNTIRVRIVNQGGTLARSIVVTADTDITINPATSGGSIVAGETANAIAAAVNADVNASRLVTATPSEGDGTGTVVAVGFTTLSGGTEQALTNVRTGANVSVTPDDPDTANMLRRHHKAWIEVDA